MVGDGLGASSSRDGTACVGWAGRVGGFRKVVDVLSWSEVDGRLLRRGDYFSEGRVLGAICTVT